MEYERFLDTATEEDGGGGLQGCRRRHYLYPALSEVCD